jgi:hypothetical protein
VSAAVVAIAVVVVVEGAGFSTGVLMLFVLFVK